MTDENKQYWYITYQRNRDFSVGVTAEYCVSPAQWSIDVTEKYQDGPYIVVWAQVITEEQHTYMKGNMA